MNGEKKYLLVEEELEKNWNLLVQEIAEKILGIIKKPQSGEEKRIALFGYLESLDFGELSPQEKKRVDYLLQSRLYSELAKKSMKEYKKLTVEAFSGVE